eukprot:COSAG06_NODE_63506_length_262_cov_0.631902_1_plen_59_part_01
MDAQQRYLFDLNGVIVVRNALSQEQVAAANAEVDRHTSPDVVQRDAMAKSEGALHNRRA